MISLKIIRITIRLNFLQYRLILLFQHRIARMETQLQAAKALTYAAAHARDQKVSHVKVYTILINDP